MRIGYSCKTLAVPGTAFRSCTLKYANEDNIGRLTSLNLAALDKTIEYNQANGIKLFRICSDLVPFGSHPVNKLNWREIYKDKFLSVGGKIIKYGMRVSVHPGQYTVLNSLNEDVVERAVSDLIYHADILDSLGMNESHKIILHIGGLYGDKKNSINRFIRNFSRLPDNIKRRLVIENDDKFYDISDLIGISYVTGLPVVMDILHHRMLKPDNRDIGYWLNLAFDTWKDTPKIHYSDQNNNLRAGAHSESIDIDNFLSFFNTLTRDTDIMLEVKDKNISALKCINLTTADRNPERLTAEENRYKYKILECSPAHYRELIELDLDAYPVYEFYSITNKAMSEKPDNDNRLRAAREAYESISKNLTASEKDYYMKAERYSQSEKFPVKRLKNILYKYSIKYNLSLQESYYFL